MGSVGVRHLEDLVAFQLAREFKLAVYALVRQSPGAARDFGFRDQIFASASSVQTNVCEGFHRFGAAEMARFLSIARASAEETKWHVLDGVERGHFDRAAIKPSLVLAGRTLAAIAGLQRSLRPHVHKPTPGSASRGPNARRPGHPRRS